MKRSVRASLTVASPTGNRGAPSPFHGRTGYALRRLFIETRPRQTSTRLFVPIRTFTGPLGLSSSPPSTASHYPQANGEHDRPDDEGQFLPGPTRLLAVESVYCREVRRLVCIDGLVFDDGLARFNVGGGKARRSTSRSSRFVLFVEDHGRRQ